MGSTRARLCAALAVAAVASLGITAFATGAGKAPAAKVGSGTASATKSVCGLGNGKKATGKPILLEGIFTLVPGIDFTTIGKIANDYFQCVNDNGGINGQRVVYKLYTEQLKPDAIAALAKKIVEQDHAVGVVGNTSLLDCAVNHKYYEAQHLYVIVAGVPGECFETPNIAPVNMGPRYSADGAVQTAILEGAKSIAFDQSNVPGTAYNLGGAKLIAAKHHVKITFLTENAASINGSTAAEREIQAAGSDHGAVVLVFTPPVAQAILQGAQHLGLENKVIWTCATPCNTDSLAKSLGPQWNHKLFTNAEMNDVHTDNGPDATLFKQVIAQYGQAVKGGIGSFSQFGWTLGRLAVKALLSIKSHVYTAKTVNAAFKALKNYKTDMLCKPWYYGPLPNNTDYTVWPENGTMQIVPTSGCLPIDPIDPEVAKARAYEKAHGL